MEDDDEKEEEIEEEENEEEEEDLNDIPLFEDTSWSFQITMSFRYQLRVLQFHLQALFWHKALI